MERVKEIEAAIDGLPPEEYRRIVQWLYVREGNRWRRFYGFVGRHALTRVPAEEVEFPAPWQHQWFPVSADLDARIIVDGTDVAAPGPIPVEVRLKQRNT